MIWTTTAVYFLVYGIVIWFGFILYAKTLLYFGGVGGVTKILVSFVAYVLFACLLVSPLFMSSSFIQNWKTEYNTNNAYMVYFLLCFLLYPIFGWLYFKKFYLQDLRALGYFVKGDK